MTTNPLYHMTITDPGNVSADMRHTGGLFTVSPPPVIVDDTEVIQVDAGADVAGGHATGSKWFVASVTLPNGSAWFQLEADLAADTVNRWQLAWIRIEGQDYSLHHVTHRDNTNRDTSGAYVRMVQGRLASSTAGEPLVDIEADHTGPLIVRCYWQIENISQDTTVGGSGAKVQRLGVRAGVLPSRTATFVEYGTEAAPGIDIDPHNSEGRPLAMVATMTEDASGALVHRELVAPVDGVLRYRYPGILPPGTDYNLECQALFGRYGPTLIEHSEDFFLNATPAANAATFTATQQGTAVLLNYDTARCQIECTYDDGATWEPVVVGSASSGAVVDLLHYPRLNTPVRYRAWHTNYDDPVNNGLGYVLTSPGAAGYDDVTGEAGPAQDEDPF